MQDTEQNQNQIVTSNGEKKVQGEFPDPMDVFYTEVGNDIFKRNVPFLNEVLRQLLTLSVRLMGGSLFFLSEATCDQRYKFVAICFFFFAMLAAFIGVLPFRDSVRIGDPAHIRASIKKAITWKDGFVWTASIFLILGFFVMLIGTAINK